MVEALASLASMPATIGPGTAEDPGTRSTGSRPSLRWPACRRRSATRSPRARSVDRCGRPRVPSARPEILEHVHQVKALALLASMPATRSPRGRAVDRSRRPRAPSARPEIREHGPPGQGPRFAHHAAGLSIGVDGRGHHRHGWRSWNTSTGSRPSLRWPACRRRSATRSPRGRSVDRCGRPRAPSARPEILEHVHQLKALASLASMPATRSPRGRTVDRCGRPRARSARAEILEHVHRVEALASLASMPATRSPRGRSVDRCGRPRVPSARAEILEHVHQVEALASLASMPATIGDTFTTRPGCRSEWTAAGTIGTGGDPGTRPPGRDTRFAGQHANDDRRHVHHGPGLSIGVDGRGQGRRSWNTVHQVEALALLASMPAPIGDTFTTRPGCRSVWMAAGPGGDPGTRPPGRGPRFAGQHPGDGRRHVHHAAGLSIGVDGRGHHRHGRRSWNTSTRSKPSLCSPRGRAVDRCGQPRAPSARPEILEHVHQVKALALLTTRPGCRSVWTAAGTIGTAGDPGTRPPGQSPRFAGQHAGDTFTTRPGCRSVWMAAGTGGDPGTRPPGRGPRFAHHGPGLSIGRGHGDTFTARPGCRSVWTAAGTAGAGGDPGTRPPG